MESFWRVFFNGSIERYATDGNSQLETPKNNNPVALKNGTLFFLQAQPFPCFERLQSILHM